MSGRSPPFYCTLILSTMHSHQSHPNITTVVIHSYEYSMSIKVPSRHTGIGAWDNSKMYILVYCIISLIVMQGYFKKKTQNAPRPSEHPPVVGGKKHRIHGKLGIQLSF